MISGIAANGGLGRSLTALFAGNGSSNLTDIGTVAGSNLEGNHAHAEIAFLEYDGVIGLLNNSPVSHSGSRH